MYIGNTDREETAKDERRFLRKVQEEARAKKKLTDDNDDEIVQTECSEMENVDVESDSKENSPIKKTAKRERMTDEYTAKLGNFLSTCERFNLSENATAQVYKEMNALKDDDLHVMVQSQIHRLQEENKDE